MEENKTMEMETADTNETNVESESGSGLLTLIVGAGLVAAGAAIGKFIGSKKKDKEDKPKKKKRLRLVEVEEEAATDFEDDFLEEMDENPDTNEKENEK